MPRNSEDVTLGADVWTEMTNADASVVSAHVIEPKGKEIRIMGRPDDTPPTGTAGRIIGTVDREIKIDLVEAFGPGTVRLFGLSASSDATVNVDHRDIA